MFPDQEAPMRRFPLPALLPMLAALVLLTATLSVQADRTRLVETERASEEVLNLPIFPSLTESEQCRVIEVVADYFANAANKVAA